MAEIVLFHHVQGLTPGVRALAEQWRAAGHVVRTPDLHGREADPSFAGEGDLDAARALVASTTEAELFLYPGDRHLFADSSLPSYDKEATALLERRVIEFLSRIR